MKSAVGSIALCGRKKSRKKPGVHARPALNAFQPYILCSRVMVLAADRAMTEGHLAPVGHDRFRLGEPRTAEKAEVLDTGVLDVEEFDGRFDRDRSRGRNGCWSHK
jgi:hypothetical protein